MSSVFTALIVLVTLLVLTPLLYHLPQAVLAAIIIMAVVGLVNVQAIRHAWHAHKHEGVAAIVTFFATLAFAPIWMLASWSGRGSPSCCSCCAQ
ncbi:MAG: SulP family inorganic anion transporter [Thiobacillaceae bacterium]